MINGSVSAPYRHDSFWPEKYLVPFRKAVYYLHKPVFGRDASSILRELLTSRTHMEENLEKFERLLETLHRVVHQQAEMHGDSALSDEKMFNLGKNLLVITNYLLIAEYGTKSTRTMDFVLEDSSKEEAYKQASEEASAKFQERIECVYKNIEDAVLDMDERSSKTKQRENLILKEGAKVLAEIPSIFPLNKEKGSLVVTLQETQICNYAFHPYEPIGWVRVGGNVGNDMFADDSMASPGLIG